MATSFWSGDKAEFLLNKLSLKSGTQIVSTDEDPRITSIDANKGSIAEFNGKWYRKQNDGNTTAWSPFVGFSDDSIYEVFNAEYGDLTDFTNTTINTTTPISGLADYEVTSFPAETPVVTLDPARVNSSDGSVTFRYTLASGTAKAVIYDQDSNEVISSELEANTAKRARLEWTPENTQTSYQLIFEDVSSGTGLFYDSVVYSDSPKETKEFTVTGGKRLRSGSRASAGTISNFSADSSTGKFSQLFTVSSGVYTALVDSFVSASISGAIQSGNSDIAIVYKGSYIGRDGQSVGGGYYSSTSAEFEIKAGESFSFDTVSVGDVSGIEANFTATATKEGTVYASDTIVGEFLVKGSSNSSNSLTANTDPVVFTEVTDTHNSWNGSQLTVPEKGAYTFNGSIRIDESATIIDIGLYVNGALRTRYSNEVATKIQKFSITDSFNENDIVELRIGSNVTLNPSPDYHHLTITKASSNYDNLIVDVGTKHISGGEEYPTGDTINGKSEFGRLYKATGVSLTGATAVGSDDLRGYENISFGKFSWGASGSTFPIYSLSGSDYVYPNISSATGFVQLVIAGNTVTDYYIEVTYTKP